MKSERWLESAMWAAPQFSAEPKAGEVQRWKAGSNLAMFAVISASASIVGWPALASDWSETLKDTQEACLNSNLVLSLALDSFHNDPSNVERWSKLLAREILGELNNHHLQAWSLSFVTAFKCLNLSNENFNEEFQSNCLCISRPEKDPDMNGIALKALITVVIISAGSLIVQLTRPSDEFRKIRELAKKYEWARLLCRHGPLLAERTCWSVEKAWDRSLLGNNKAMSEACQQIAEVTDCECISPKIGTAFCEDTMQADEGKADAWVLSLESCGLRNGNTIIQRAIVETSSSDGLILHYTAENRLSQRCLELLNESTSQNTVKLHQDVLDAVRDAARSDDEYEEWLNLITQKSPERDLKLLEPSIGAKLNENSMFAQNDSWSPSKATVSEIICPGLLRNEEVLVRAKVKLT